MGRIFKAAAALGRLESMEGRRALFVAFLLAAVCTASSVEVQELGVQELGEAKVVPPPTSVTVMVSPNEPKPPPVTIKTLLPSVVKKLTAKYVANNGGKQPSVRDAIEIKRLAVIDASKQIATSQRAKDAKEAAARKLKRMNRQLEHEYKIVAKTEQNIDYAARKEYVKADANVKRLEKKYHKSLDKSEAMSENNAMYVMQDRNAVKDRKYISKQVKKYKKMNGEAQQNEEKSREYVDKARALEAKTKAKAAMSVVDTKKYNTMLNNVEYHEAQARLKMRQARIKGEFEHTNARKFGMLLSRLTAKRDTVKRFTKNLKKKSSEDFKAATAGITNAKAKYAAAKAKYDEYTKKAGELEEAYQGTLKIIRLARMTVVNSIDTGNPAAAIAAAERHKHFDRMKKRDKKKVENMDHKAKTQQLKMNAALADLAKAEALETVARKQIDMVKEHEVTMKAQEAKMSLLKNEVAKHKAAAKAAQREAHEHYLKRKGMRRHVREERNSAQTRERYAPHISLPMSKRMQEKAKLKYARDKFRNKAEQDDIRALQKDRVQIAINARNARKKSKRMAKRLKIAIDNTWEDKKLLAKAEARRNKTLDHNKRKMKEMRDRLTEAENHFKKAGGNDLAIAEVTRKVNGEAH